MCVSSTVFVNSTDKKSCFRLWITVNILCVCMCVCLILPGGRPPAACQWEVVYPTQTLAVYTALFITGRVLLNYHMIYGLALCVCECVVILCLWKTTVCMFCLQIQFTCVYTQVGLIPTKVFIPLEMYFEIPLTHKVMQNRNKYWTWFLNVF